MIPSDDPDGDIMNTPCPKCNEWSPDFKENEKSGAAPKASEPAPCSAKRLNSLELELNHNTL